MEFLKLIREKYSQIEELEQYTDDAKRGLFRWEEELLLPYLKSGERYLVFGSGAGREVFGLGKRGINAVGIEISMAQIESAEQLKKLSNTHAAFVNANALSLPFRSMSFDSALMFRQFLQHFPGRLNRKKLLTEAHRVLVPGGLLFLSVNLNPFGLGPLRIANYLYRRQKRVARGQRKNVGAQHAVPIVGDIQETPKTEERVNGIPTARNVFYKMIVSFTGGVVFGLKNLYRHIMIFFLGRHYRGPELGDHLISQVSSARSSGKIWFHSYSYSEIVKELKANGFEILKINDVAELETGRNIPEVIRKGAMFIAIVARKIE